MLKYQGQTEGKTMNEARTVDYISSIAVPSRDEFEDSRAALGATIRAGTATEKTLLAHRALTDYWNGKLDRWALMNRLAQIEARS